MDLPTFPAGKLLHPSENGGGLPVDAPASPIWGSRGALLLFGLLLGLAVIGVGALRVGPGQVDLREGEAAPQDIVAPHKVRFVSQLLTNEAKEQAAADRANLVYVYDATVAGKQRTELLGTLRAMGNLRQASGDSLQRRLEQLQQLGSARLSVDDAATVLGLNDAGWEAVANASLQVLDQAMRAKLSADVLGEQASHLRDALPRDLTEPQASLVALLASAHLKPNLVLDEAATQRKRQEARNRTQPVEVELVEGQSIVRRGDIVRGVDLEKLEAAGLRTPRVLFGDIIGRSGISIILVALFTAYLGIFHPQVYGRPRVLLMLGLVMVGALLVARFLVPGRSVMPFLFPMAAVSMLLAVLLDIHVALIATIVLSLILGYVAGGPLGLIVAYFASGAAGAFVIWRAERARTFAVAGLAVAAANLLVVVSFRRLEGGLDLQGAAEILGASALNGVLSASLTFMAFGLLGSVFGITTVLQLLDLAHPNQPLMRRLMREAPGTYFHSLMVADLAGQCAELVGADVLLTRVAAFYHDIGKTLRPYFFIENQAGRANVHDSLDPTSSAVIVASHVRDGLELGKQVGLPRRILDVVAQHHGTTRISFFYQRALELEGEIDQTVFRYPGPKPQTKEAALVMLADSVEATVRSHAQAGRFDPAAMADLAETDGSEPSGVRRALQVIVDGIISERLNDGQLDECDLTLRDIDAVRRALARSLESIYHPRVRYPSGKSEESRPRRLLRR